MITSAWYGAAMARMVSEINCSAAFHASGSRVRTVPAASPEWGMTLLAEPAAICPQTSDRPARGSTRLDRMAGVRTTTSASAATTSTVSCGLAV